MKHFSHEHPMILNGEKDLEDEINPNDFCNICNMPLLLSSFYSCSIAGCKYFLHEPCALLPQKLRHTWNLYESLDLLVKPRHEYCFCGRCRQPCENFNYSSIHLHLHPMCAAPLEIKSRHRSHPSHPLVAICKETSALCDACGQEQKGYFFSCQQCNFWIHVDCCLLPRIAKYSRHDHSLILSYSHTNDSFQKPGALCLLCSKRRSGYGAYLCGECGGFVHIRCAVISHIKDHGTEAKLEIIDLPADDLDGLWSSMIQRIPKMRLEEGDQRRDGANEEGNLASDHEAHEHPLILHHEEKMVIYIRISSSRSSIEPYLAQELTCCNACIGPIYPPYYVCSESQYGRCHFHLHQHCSNLPSKITRPTSQITTSPPDVLRFFQIQDLTTWSKVKTLCSLFYCIACNLPTNGLSYCNKYGRHNLDILCLSAPSMIKHESHKGHVLCSSFSSVTITMNCCPRGSVYSFWYGCMECSDFAIHVGCALLPKKVEHKFDRHPLSLITDGINKDPAADSFCEFCEEHVDTRFWYYGCEECDNLFHVKCIPSVGYLSRVKFGDSITASCHPPHPVTLIRMLGFGSQSCGYCKQIIKGFVDQMAFHCSRCDFWMHFLCAEECTGAKKLLDPWDRSSW